MYSLFYKVYHRKLLPTSKYVLNLVQNRVYKYMTNVIMIFVHTQSWIFLVNYLSNTTNKFNKNEYNKTCGINRPTPNLRDIFVLYFTVGIL